MSTMKISVLLPIKNQSQMLLDNLKAKVLPYFDSCGLTYEVIICYDGSNEENQKIIEEALPSLPAHVRATPYEAKLGKGHNVSKAVLASNGDYCLFMDADMATDLKVFDLMKPDLGKVDALIASRDLKGSVYVNKQRFKRRLIHRLSKIWIRFKLHSKGIHDTQCGYKCFRTPLAKVIASRSIIDGFAFDCEYLYFLLLNGYSIKEYPCAWDDGPDSSIAHPFHASADFMKDLRRIKGNKRAYILTKEEKEALC